MIRADSLAELVRPGPDEPFCFVRGRMKHVWRRADRAADGRGRPVDGTVGSSRARRYWSSILGEVLWTDAVLRLRVRDCDRAAVVMTESRYRALEAEASRPGS
jgi:hypothetical protein